MKCTKIRVYPDGYFEYDHESKAYPWDPLAIIEFCHCANKLNINIHYNSETYTIEFDKNCIDAARQFNTSSRKNILVNLRKIFCECADIYDVEIITTLLASKPLKGKGECILSFLLGGDEVCT